MTAAQSGQVVVPGAAEALVLDQLPGGLELIDLGEHRLRDLGRPTRVFQLVRDGCRKDFPPLRTLASLPRNLPAQVSSFIRRQAESTSTNPSSAQRRGQPGTPSPAAAGSVVSRLRHPCAV